MAIRSFSKQGRLTDAELERLTEFLSKAESAGAMNIEEFDGFLSALVAGPELVPPSEYLPVVFGSDMADAYEFSGLEEANEILGLIMRHWNEIVATLENGDVHVPVLLEDGNGVCLGSDWANGFVRGMTMRITAWSELLGDEKEGDCLVPVLILHHEFDEDPELRPPPISPEMREEIIVQMAAGIVRVYRYFKAHRGNVGRSHGATPPRNHARTGRNEPCPCGSGKKYKRCCGAPTVH